MTSTQVKLIQFILLFDNSSINFTPKQTHQHWHATGTNYITWHKFKTIEQ